MAGFTGFYDYPIACTAKAAASVTPIGAPRMLPSQPTLQQARPKHVTVYGVLDIDSVDIDECRLATSVDIDE
jgi:hypothetical protein